MRFSRRQLILSLAASVAAPDSIFGQAGPRMNRVAIVFSGSVDSDRVFLEPFLQGLRKHGYREGVDVKLELSYADGRTERVLSLIQEAVASEPRVIVLQGSAAGWAAKKATSMIPIVLAQVADPVGLGLVASLARPGGNITGNSIQPEAFVPKALELLHQTLPHARTVAVMTDPAMQATPQLWAAVENTAKRLSVVLERFDATASNEIDHVLSIFATRRPGALLAFPMPLFGAHRRRIIESLTRNRIPAMMTITEAAELGALMSYLVSASDMWRNAATFVHRILQGAAPSELPFEQATRFQFTINLRTAKALGLKIPQPVLLRADRVIE